MVKRKITRRKTKKPKTIRTKRLRRYTPAEQQIILNLSEALGGILPATSRGDFCLQKIAIKNRLGKYFDSKLGNKKKQFSYFIQQVFGRHPIKFKRIINDVLAEAVERRRQKGQPILRDEADFLKLKLYKLGIDLKTEIDELNLPKDRPKITPPPIHIKQSIDKIGLHQLLLDKVSPLFCDGHLNEAVRKSGEIFESHITRISGVNDKYGRDLVTTVFNVNNPILDVSGYHSSDIISGNDEKEGFLYLSMGIMSWCKNIMGHGDVEQLAPSEAASRIIIISHLLEVIDKQLSK